MTMKRYAMAAVLVVGLQGTGGTAEAGMIERACLTSERGSATRALCTCIQQVADMTLNRGDQRLAAQFFRDPHRAQEVRQSDSRKDETFWQKYKAFGLSAEGYCR